MVLRAPLGRSLTVGAMGLVSNPAQLLVLRVLQGLVTGTVPATAALVSSIAPPAVRASLGIVQTARCSRVRRSARSSAAVHRDHSATASPSSSPA
jgi:MFS family permease